MFNLNKDIRDIYSWCSIRRDKDRKEWTQDTENFLGFVSLIWTDVSRSFRIEHESQRHLRDGKVFAAQVW